MVITVAREDDDPLRLHWRRGKNSAGVKWPGFAARAAAALQDEERGRRRRSSASDAAGSAGRAAALVSAGGRDGRVRSAAPPRGPRPAAEATAQPPSAT